MKEITIKIDAQRVAKIAKLRKNVDRFEVSQGEAFMALFGEDFRDAVDKFIAEYVNEKLS